MVIGDGQHLDAGLQGVEPDHQLQVQRDREEDAHQDQVLAEQADQAGAQRRRSSAAPGAPAGRVPIALPVPLPRGERPQQGAARARSRRASARSRTARPGSLFGLTQPQVLDCSTPRTTRPRPAADSTRADEVELAVPGRSAPRRPPSGVITRIRATSSTSPSEDDPPRVLGGRPAAQDRPDRDPGPGDAADHGVGRPCARRPRSCRRSAPPSPAAPARRRAPPGPTSRGSARPPSAPAPSAPNRSA